MKGKNFALILSLALLFCMSSAFAQTTYSFETVDYSGDTFTQLLGINNNGIVAGYHGTTNKGFTYTVATKTFTSENVPGSAQTQVIGINDKGKTVGFFISAKGNKTEGFTDAAGTFTSVNYPKTPFNQLLSQNNNGQAAGYYSKSTSGVPDTAYVYDEFGGVFEVFYIPGSTSAQATGINDASSVCGFFIDESNNMHGWLKIQGHFTQLDYPGSKGTTAALGLNNNGQVVGSYADSSGNTHGFVYNVSSDSWQSIDDPDGIGTTVVNGINDNGTLVGFYGPQVCTGSTCSGFIATAK